MKTFKKALSVILCLCMIMSVMAAGLNAFAQEEATAALDGAVSEAAALAVSDPTDEKPDVDAMGRCAAAGCHPGDHLGKAPGTPF